MAVCGRDYPLAIARLQSSESLRFFFVLQILKVRKFLPNCYYFYVLQVQQCYNQVGSDSVNELISAEKVVHLTVSCYC